MAGLGTSLANALLDAVLGNPNYPTSLGSASVFGPSVSVPSLYVALFTATPSASGGGTECAGTGYARAPVSQNTTNWPAASSASKTNGAAISFGQAGAGDWGTLTAWGIYDALTGGNLLFFGPLTQPSAVASGDAVTLPAGAVAIALT